MPLDPLVKSFLDQLTAAARPKTWEVTPDQSREGFAALMRMAGPRDVPIGRTTNLFVETSDHPVPVRLYTPVAAGGEALPALIYFHGGGFIFGDLETHDGLCRMIANEAQCKVLAVDYRLAPEHKFPAATDDAWAVLQHVDQNAAELGIDANRIAVGGDSAGGNLAAGVAQRAHAKGMRLVYQLLLFPVTQIGDTTSSLMEFSAGYMLEKKALEYFYEQYLPAGADLSDPLVSPLRAKDMSGLPPAYVMLGGYDPLHDEGEQYAEKMRASGVKVIIDDHTDMVHCFVYFQSVLPQARDALTQAARALKAAFAAS
jgi:acetyl esterase